MRHRVLWTLVLLGLPQIATAHDPAGVAVPALPGGEPGIDRAETPSDASPPAFDVRIDPPRLRSSSNPPSGGDAIEAEPADRYTGAGPRSADRGLSFGLEVKPRSAVGSLARKDESEDPNLQEQIQRFIERPAFGVRGRYRF